MFRRAILYNAKASALRRINAGILSMTNMRNSIAHDEMKGMNHHYKHLRPHLSNTFSVAKNEKDIEQQLAQIQRRIRLS